MGEGRAKIAARSGGLSLRLAVALLAATAASPAAPAGAQSGPAGCDGGEVRIRLSHSAGEEGSPKADAAAALSALLNERLDGRYCLELLPNGQRFSDSEALRALQRGDLEMAAPTLGTISSIAPEFQIFTLPFLFRDPAALHWFQNTGPGARLRRGVKRAGLIGLAYWNQGMRQLSADRPLRAPRDARGVAFRISGSRVQQETFAQLGAAARVIAFADASSALSAGRVQGQENTWTNILEAELFHNQDGVTETNHSVLLSLLVASERFWSALPSSDRGAITSIVSEVTRAQQRSWVALEDRSREALAAAGMEIRMLSASEREAWVAAMKPIWSRHASVIGAALIDTASRAAR